MCVCGLVGLCARQIFEGTEWIKVGRWSVCVFVGWRVCVPARILRAPTGSRWGLAWVCGCGLVCQCAREKF